MKSGIKKVQVKCNNCGSGDDQFVTFGLEHEYDNTTDDTFRVVRCRRCGLLYLNPRPDVSELSTIYPDGYYAYHLQEKSEEAKSNRSLLYWARKQVYLSRLSRALTLCSPASSIKVLDIGCADGRALNWYRKVKSRQIETYGVDFDCRAVDKARASGHKVYLGRFEETDIPDNYFDLAVATHVIEHVADPKCFALKAFQILKPGGIFLCETPNADSWDARWFANQHWGGYHFPRHWTFYDSDSIRSMAGNVGFEVVRIDYHPAPAFWNWTFHSMVKSWGAPNTQTKERFKNAADKLFPPVDFQRNTLRNLIAVACFTGFDLAVKLLSGKTSNMSVVLRKPQV